MRYGWKAGISFLKKVLIKPSPPLRGRVRAPGKQLRIVFSEERAELTAKAYFFGLAC